MGTNEAGTVLNLDDLLLDLTGLDEHAVIELGEKTYREMYVGSGSYGIRQTHDGEDVRFWASRFRHAFCTANDFRFSNDKECVDRPRVERVAWIGEVISGRVPNSACWLIRQNLTKRLYTVVPKGYVVWLEYKGGKEWTFSTAYVTQPNKIHGYTRGERRIWKK